MTYLQKQSFFPARERNDYRALQLLQKINTIFAVAGWENYIFSYCYANIKWKDFELLLEVG